MNTYLLPIADGDYAWIEKCVARSFTEAKQKFAYNLIEDYELEIGLDLKEVKYVLLNQHQIVIGELYDKEEF